MKFVKRILDEESKDKNFIVALNNILLNTDYDPNVYEATYRILSVLLSEVDRKIYKDTQIQFFKSLMHNELQPKHKISKYVLLGCLTNLLRIDYLVKLFLELGGAEMYNKKIK